MDYAERSVQRIPEHLHHAIRDVRVVEARFGAGPPPQAGLITKHLTKDRSP